MLLSFFDGVGDVLFVSKFVLYFFVVFVLLFYFYVADFLRRGTSVPTSFFFWRCDSACLVFSVFCVFCLMRFNRVSMFAEFYLICCFRKRQPQCCIRLKFSLASIHS